ncbi:MAG: hypothetical protein SGARI_002495, partial [Bacillariaceae sp.]
MRKKSDSNGSSSTEQSVDCDDKPRREPRSYRASIRPNSSLFERARSFDSPGNVKSSSNIYNVDRTRRSSWAQEKEPAYLFVSPTLSGQRRQSMEESILTNMKNEQSLLMPRQSPQKTLVSFPKRTPVGPNMKALLDASNHRHISAVKPFQLPLSRPTAKAILIDDKPINKHAFKLKKVCAPKLHVDLNSFKPPVNPKTEWQRNLLLKAIKNNFMLKNNHEKTEDALVDAMEKISVPKGSILAKQGANSEEEDNFYVLQEGRVEFLVDDERVRTAEAGESFGQERLLLRVPNETTVKAIEPSILLRLNQSDFRTIMEKTITEELASVQEEKPQKPPMSPSFKAVKTSAKSTKRTVKHTVGKKKQKKGPTMIEIFDPSSLEKHSVDFKRQAKIRSSLKKHAANKDDLEFIKVLGEGQFGEVWLVAAQLPDIDPNRQEFALKIQNKDEEEIREDA